MTDRVPDQEHNISVTASTVAGLFLGALGAAPIFFKVDTVAGKVLTSVVSLMVAAGFVMAVRLWPRSNLNRWFIVVATCTVVLLLVSLFLVAASPGKPRSAQDQGTGPVSARPAETTSSGSPTESKHAVERTVYLDTLEPVGGYTDLVPSTAVVNGERYEHALVNQMETWVTCGDGAKGGDIEYNLERKFETFHARVGLTDTVNSGVSYTFLVYGDGELLKSANAELGKPSELAVRVQDVLRLRLVQSDCGDTGAVVWADPTLTRAAGQN